MLNELFVFIFRFIPALAFVLSVSSALAANNEIQGAGSSLANTVVQGLIQEYSAPHHVDITYKSVGSGEGIRSIAAGAVDFALTDVPLTLYELKLLDVIQFPVLFSAITPVVNIPGIATGELKLTGSVLAEIYLGNITKWNDPKLVALNPQSNLPNLAITVLARSDASGSSYIFTGYLSRVYPRWAQSLGVGSKLIWPVGSGVRGTSGMIKALKETSGAIGYVEFGDALRSHVSTVQLESAGTYVQPSLKGIEQSINEFKWQHESFYPLRDEYASENEWPMVAVTYSLMRRVCGDDEDARDTITFMHWILTNKNQNISLQYMQVPQSTLMIRSIERQLSQIVNPKGTVIQPFSAPRGEQR